jgi:hypothetical protein
VWILVAALVLGAVLVLLTSVTTYN